MMNKINQDICNIQHRLNRIQKLNSPNPHISIKWIRELLISINKSKRELKKEYHTDDILKIIKYNKKYLTIGLKVLNVLEKQNGIYKSTTRIDGLAIKGNQERYVNQLSYVNYVNWNNNKIIEISKIYKKEPDGTLQKVQKVFDNHMANYTRRRGMMHIRKNLSLDSIYYNELLKTNYTYIVIGHIIGFV